MKKKSCDKNGNKQLSLKDDLNYQQDSKRTVLIRIGQNFKKKGGGSAPYNALKAPCDPFLSNPPYGDL